MNNYKLFDEKYQIIPNKSYNERLVLYYKDNLEIADGPVDTKSKNNCEHNWRRVGNGGIRGKIFGQFLISVKCTKCGAKGNEIEAVGFI